MEKVPVQKGPIVVDSCTYKNDTHEYKVKERRKEVNAIRDGQTMKYRSSKKK